MLLVQKFLTSKTFGDLEREHGVNISVDSRNGHKFSLNYDQIEAVESDVLSQQCRGLILSNGSSLWEQARIVNGRKDYSHVCPGSTRVIAYPMHRFFNYGQGSAADIHWSDPKLKAFEKLDGTLCILYFDQIIHEWHVATRSVPEADIPLECQVYTFRTLFEEGLMNVGSVSFKEFCSELDVDNTYCFELTSPYNRVVVKYEKSGLHVLAVRNKHLGFEIDPSTDAALCSYVPLAVAHDLGSMDKVIEYVNSRSPMDHEGIVLRDGSFRRIKVKNAAYVAYNRARDSLASSPRACLELVLSEKDDDVLPYMPEAIANTLIDIKAKVSSFVREFDSKYAQLQMYVLDRYSNDLSVQGWNDKKLFAICLQEFDIWKTPCFQIKAGKVGNLREFIKANAKYGSWSNSFLDTMLDEIGFEVKQ